MDSREGRDWQSPMEQEVFINVHELVVYHKGTKVPHLYQKCTGNCNTTWAPACPAHVQTGMLCLYTCLYLSLSVCIGVCTLACPVRRCTTGMLAELPAHMYAS